MLLPCRREPVPCDFRRRSELHRDPSSLAVPSVAYGATFRLAGPKGERMVPAADYFTMPTLQNVKTENVLAPTSS